ncbi:hypothetical protein RND81_04G076200 [Saponaria officinalis]|uniref:Uncharacterized protein n=1 Tax=Saponaria officinalis TaxID=3572 RepID=A0AAW1LDJ7_SAPOF
MAEQKNEILLKNHQSRPIGFDPFPKVNAIKYDHKNKGPDHAISRGRGRGYRQGRGNNFENYQGVRGHWSRTCHTRKHFVDLYQQSLNDKRENKIEANFATENDKIETNFADGKDNYSGFLDVSDSFSDPDGTIDHLIGDGSVQKHD